MRAGITKRRPAEIVGWKLVSGYGYSQVTGEAEWPTIGRLWQCKN
jgi:hypothetical protein